MNTDPGRVGTDSQTSILLEILQKKIYALNVAPKVALPPRIVVAKSGVTMEMTPVPLHPVNVDQALGSLQAIMKLVIDSRQSRRFGALLRCGSPQLPRASFHVDLDEEESGPATT